MIQLKQVSLHYRGVEKGVEKETDKGENKVQKKLFSRLLSFQTELQATLKPRLVLDQLSIKAPPHSIIALMGPSGIGKTSLLRLILGLEPLSTGEIYLSEQLIQTAEYPLNSSSTETAQRSFHSSAVYLPPNQRPFAYSAQEPLLFPFLTVKDNILFGLTLPHAEQTKRLDWVLELLELKIYCDRLPAQLSGGQQKRVALARALVRPSELLLLDEPFSSLDTKLSLHIQNKLFPILKHEHKTVIWSTHQINSALKYADQIWYLENPQTLYVGSPEELLHHCPSKTSAEFFGPVSWIDISILKKYHPALYATLNTEQKEAKSLGFRPSFWQLYNEETSISIQKYLNCEVRITQIEHGLSAQTLSVVLKTEIKQVSSLHNLMQLRINLPHHPHARLDQEIKVYYTAPPIILRK